MRRLLPILSALFILSATGCAGPAPLAVTVDGPLAPYAPDYLTAGDLTARAVAASVSAAEVWGASPDSLDGYVLVFEQRPFACGRTGAEAGRIVGCTRESEHTIQVLALGAACPEATVIAHEIGHAVLGDDEHHDPRWRDPSFWGRMLVAMERTAPPDCSLGTFVDLNRVHDAPDEEGHDD